MTLDDVRIYGRRALLPLPNGTILRYQPEDGRVRVLAYPCRPDKWDRLPILCEDIPREGWRHIITCTCSHCHPVRQSSGLDD